jgi:hypothetical protein
VRHVDALEQDRAKNRPPPAGRKRKVQQTIGQRERPRRPVPRVDRREISTHVEEVHHPHRNGEARLHRFGNRMYAAREQVESVRFGNFWMFVAGDFDAQVRCVAAAQTNVEGLVAMHDSSRKMVPARAFQGLVFIGNPRLRAQRTDPQKLPAEAFCKTRCQMRKRPRPNGNQ